MSCCLGPRTGMPRKSRENTLAGFALAIEAGAEEGVDHEVGAGERLLERGEERALGELGEGAAEIDVGVEVDPALAGDLLRGAGQEDLDLGAAGEEVAGDDEAVSPVVARAADDHIRILCERNVSRRLMKAARGLCGDDLSRTGSTTRERGGEKMTA